MPRDKFAAMASRASAESQPSTTPGLPDQSQTPQSTTPSGTSAPPTAAVNQPPPRRDKLAALASRQATTTTHTVAAPPVGRGNKLAAMAANNARAPAEGESSSTVPPKEDAKKKELSTQDEQFRAFQKEISKRDKILENLDRAEEMTCKLLQIAHQTTTALQDLTGETDVSSLSKAYRETLRAIHPLLSTDTQELIKPYQNHTTETKQSMYAARVEMRLAKERTQVLKDLIASEQDGSEQQGEEENGNNKKRPREEGVAIG